MLDNEDTSNEKLHSATAHFKAGFADLQEHYGLSNAEISEVAMELKDNVIGGLDKAADALIESLQKFKTVVNTDNK